MNCKRPPAVLFHIFSLLTAALLVVTSGCRQPASDSPTTKQPASSIAVVKPERKTIRREVGQPGSIQAFERTPIVARIPGYVLKWNVDIGDSVGEKDILAELWVPEMDAELKLKEEQVEQAKKALEIARAQVDTAEAQVKEIEAGLSRAESNHDYWKGQSGTFHHPCRGQGA